jgi:hypothetical protein
MKAAVPTARRAFDAAPPAKRRRLGNTAEPSAPLQAAAGACPCCGHAAAAVGADHGAKAEVSWVAFMLRTERQARMRGIAELRAELSIERAGPSATTPPAVPSVVDVAPPTKQVPPDHPLARFLEEACTVKPWVRAPSGVVSSAYRNWCAAQNVAPLNNIAFAREMKGFFKRAGHPTKMFFVGVAPAAHIAASSSPPLSPSQSGADGPGDEPDDNPETSGHLEEPESAAEGEPATDSEGTENVAP